MSPTLYALALAAVSAHAVPSPGEPALARAARLRATAADAVHAVEASRPLPGHTAEGTLRIVLATAIVESAGFRLDVDKGDARGDHGRSVCLMQINVGKGRVASADHEVSTWRAGDLLADRRKCFRAGIEAARWSMTTCAAAGLRGADTLAAYVSGRCQPGFATARHRWFLAERMAAASVRDEPVCRV